MISHLLDNNPLWQFSLAEKAAVLHLLSCMPQRRTAIEIGSYKGGFLRVLAHQFHWVFSLDIDHSHLPERPNVRFVAGDSKQTLPQLNHLPDVDLILIDGDHAFETVLADINNALTFTPTATQAILIHDSWYTPTREAITQANWAENPYVYYVEKDFVPGDMVGSPDGNLFVGGLALALLSPLPRAGELVIRQSQDYMYRMCLGK